VTFHGNLRTLQEEYRRRGWTDGLPVLPALETDVAAMVEASARSPQESLGAIPPRYGEATIEVLAANAVMAGCSPDHFGIVLTAVEAMLEPEFNLYNVQATTHPVAPLLVAHGPVARTAGINGGAGALGPGVVPNAVIGRAVRLILLNVGGAVPGVGDRATHGSPAKYAFCTTENVEASPWAEFQTTRGYDADESCLTMIACEAPQNVQDHENSLPGPLLDVIANTMAHLGHNGWYLSKGAEITVGLCPEHADVLARNGWQRDDVQRYLYHRAVMPFEALKRGGMWKSRDWPPWMEALAEQSGGMLPAVRRPEDILLLVLGGEGKHSVVMPGFGASRSVTRRISVQGGADT
jgi:hypothetical protein